MFKKTLSTLSAAFLLVATIHAPLHASESEFNIDRSNVTCTNADTPTGVVSYKTESREVHVGNEENRVYGSSGLTITVQAGEQWTTHGSIDTSVSGDIDAIIAGIQAEVRTEVGIQKTVITNSSATWLIPEHIERGWVEPGNNGYQTTWIMGRTEAPCNWVELDRGTAIVVKEQVSFDHSEGLIPRA